MPGSHVSATHTSQNSGGVRLYSPPSPGSGPESSSETPQADIGAKVRMVNTVARSKALLGRLNQVFFIWQIQGGRPESAPSFLPSTSTMQLRWVYMSEFGAGISGGEPPDDNRLRLLALTCKSRYLTSQSLFIPDSTPQTLLAKDAQLYLRHPFGKLRTGFNQLPCYGV